MNDKLRADINIGVLIVFMLSVALAANYLGGQISGATTASECGMVKDCDDGNSCTLDSCLSEYCLHEEITECANGDGCCLPQCATQDSDC